MMLALGHTISGLLGGCLLIAAIPSAPVPVEALMVLTCGGAALLPDLDHPGSKAARSLGIVTRLLARMLDALSLAVYHATRSERDFATREGGHRLLTHTIPGCLLFGALASLACFLHPGAGASLLGLLAGLLGLGLKQAGASLALVTGGGAWWVLTTFPAWSAVYGVAVFVGCLSHLGGDVVTNSGIPLVWPIEVGGKRWHKVSTPATFDTGGESRPQW